MRHFMTPVAVGLAMVGTPALAAQHRAATAAAQPAEAQLVVFIRTGPNWAKRAAATPILLAHRDLYGQLADSGQIIFSGRFVGEPALGMAVFDPKVDAAAMRRLLLDDQAVADGYVIAEFRDFAVAFGALGRPAAASR